MKRVLLIFFVLVAAVGACFAVDGDMIKLTTTISSSEPEFKIHASYDTDTATGSKDSVPNLSVGSPTGDIVLGVYITQHGDCRSVKSYNLKVSATPFYKGGDAAAEERTDAPTFDLTSSLVGKDSIITVSTSGSSSEGANSVVSMDVAYKGPQAVGSDLGRIAEWTFTWPGKPALSAGSYSATITLNYTVV